MKKAKNKQISLPTEFVSIVSISDDLTSLVHIKKNNVINKIADSFQASPHSKIASYLSKHKSLKIVCNIHDSLIRVEKKNLPTQKDASRFVKISQKLGNIIFSFAKNISISKLGKQTVVICRLDKKTGHKNILATTLLLAKVHNKIAKFDLLLHSANLLFRDKYGIKDDAMLGIIIASDEYGVISAVCSKDVVMFVKNEKSSNDMQQKIQEDVHKLHSQSKHDSTGRDGHKESSQQNAKQIPFGGVIIATDIASLGKESFTCEEGKCIVDQGFSKDKLQNCNILEYIAIKASTFSLTTALNNKDIKIKNSIFIVSKIAFMCAFMLATISSLIFVNNIILGNTEIDGKIKKQNKEIKAIESSLPKSGEIEDFMLYKDLHGIMMVSKIEDLHSSWLGTITKVSQAVNKIKGAKINKYSWTCNDYDEKVIKPSIKFDITVGNESGYIHNLHFKISNIAESVRQKLGNEYVVKGLNFKYKFSLEKKYFTKNISFELVKSDEEKIETAMQDLDEVPKKDASQPVQQEQPVANNNQNIQKDSGSDDS